jgi:hypothetical protein
VRAFPLPSPDISSGVHGISHEVTSHRFVAHISATRSSGSGID